MTAFIFPGQGSQSVGMGKKIFEAFKLVRETFELASDTLSIDMKKLCFEDPNRQLILTEFTQPSLLTVSYAYFRILSQTKTSCFMAGHSLGEYSALVCSDSIKFEEALKAVRLRGKYMQESSGKKQGAMFAVIGKKEEVERLISWYKDQKFEQTLEVANYNSPTQTVLSGEAKAFDNITKKDFELKFIPLRVSAPFHSSLMNEAKKNMEKVIFELNIKNPTTDIVTNFKAQVVRDANTLRTHLIEQITKPVLWTDTVELLASLGVEKFFEVGPGRVLTGLLKKFDNLKYEAFNIENPKDFE